MKNFFFNFKGCKLEFSFYFSYFRVLKKWVLIELFEISWFHDILLYSFVSRPKKSLRFYFCNKSLQKSFLILKPLSSVHPTLITNLILFIMNLNSLLFGWLQSIRALSHTHEWNSLLNRALIFHQESLRRNTSRSFQHFPPKIIRGVRLNFHTC